MWILVLKMPGGVVVVLRSLWVVVAQCMVPRDMGLRALLPRQRRLCSHVWSTPHHHSGRKAPSLHKSGPSSLIWGLVEFTAAPTCLDQHPAPSHAAGGTTALPLVMPCSCASGILGCLEPILDMVPPLPSAAITSHKSSVADEAVQQTKGLSRALSHMMQRCTPGTSEWLEEALQEPRRPSRITALSLDGRISAECIRRKFAERHGYSCDSPAGRSKWVSVSAAVFAGLRFTLHFRFILAKAPGGSSTMQAAASRKRARFEPQEPQQPQPQPHHHQQQQPQAGAAAAASSSSSSSSGSSSNMDGSSGGSGRMCWLLQFGVSFTVPCLPKGSTPLFGIQRPMLQQPPGFSLSGGRVTRQQTAQHGCDISQQGVLLQARSVLPCADVLPVYLPDADWGMEHSSQLAPFVTGGDDVLEVKVLVQPPK